MTRRYAQSEDAIFFATMELILDHLKTIWLLRQIHRQHSPKPHQMYISAKMFGNGPRCLADISKCRYSALYENIYPIPVYSPKDRIQPFRGDLADYMWVDRGVPTSHASMFTCLPYQGPRWYVRRL